MRTPTSATSPLGGALCDIPSWVAHCIQGAIDNFNLHDPAVIVTSYDAGDQPGTPLDVIKEEARLGRFTGVGGTPTFLSYAYGCSAATLGQIAAIERAMGGPSAFAQWVAERTGETFGVDWHRDLGMWGTTSHHESVLTAGLFPFSEVTFSASDCPLLSRPIRAPDPPHVSSPSRWSDRLNLAKLGFPGAGGLLQYCVYRLVSADEESLFGDAYAEASIRVPPQHPADPSERRRLDRAWLDAFWNHAGMTAYQGRFNTDFYEAFLPFTRGSNLSTGPDGSMVILPDGTYGGVPVGTFMFSRFFLVLQCPWHP